MRSICLGAFSFLAAGLAVAQDDRPTFAEPVFMPSSSCPLTFSGTRTPQNQILSILRVAENKDALNFVAVGQGYPAAVKSFCAMEIRFEKPLRAPEKISIDMRGLELKDPNTALSVTIRIGSQDHKADYARGRWLDDLSTASKRFVIGLEAGTHGIRLALSGAAKTYDRTSNAFYAFDAFDLCFVNPARPQDCGPGGQPNPSPAASAPR